MNRACQVHTTGFDLPDRRMISAVSGSPVPSRAAADLYRPDVRGWAALTVTPDRRENCAGTQPSGYARADWPKVSDLFRTLKKDVKGLP
jgi:hypothetical protein